MKPYKIKILSVDTNVKIQAIKVVRGLTGWGLKESKELVDNGFGTIEVFGNIEVVSALRQLKSVGIEAQQPNLFVRLVSSARLRWSNRPASGRWTNVVPLYCTRPTADGEVTAWRLSLWIALLIFGTVTANAVVWPLIGLFEAVRVIFGF